MEKRILVIITAIVLALAIVTFCAASSIGTVSITPGINSGVFVTSNTPEHTTPSQQETDCEWGYYISSSNPTTSTKTVGGCFDNKTNICYPLGYVRNGTYCGENGLSYGSSTHKPGFINQLNEGQSCKQGYECKTGVCSNNICVNLTKEMNEINSKISYLENLSTSLTNNLREVQINTTKTNSTGSITGDVIASSNLGFGSKIIGFFKKLFGIK